MRHDSANSQTRRNVFHTNEANDVFIAIDVAKLDGDDDGWNIYVMTA